MAHRDKLVSAVLLAFSVCGCAEFFQLPPARSRDVALSHRTWPAPPTPAQHLGPCAIDKATVGFCWGASRPWREESKSDPTMEAAASDATKGPRVTAFLHLSDAQLRDEAMYGAPGENSNLTAVDTLLNVTVRRPLVEEYDTLTLASFIAAYRDHLGDAEEPKLAYGKPFMIHTGDLLDLSVVSELMDALEVFGYWSRSSREGPALRLFSVAGNHDGLLFGNTPEWLADSQDVGVNQSEFVIAHIVADAASRSVDEPVLGYGFAWNENIRSRAGSLRLAALEGSEPDEDKPEGKISSTSDWIRHSRLQLRDATERSLVRHQGNILQEPQTFKHAIRVPSTANDVGLSLGYYSWSHATPPDSGMKGIRYIVLDTRARVNDTGDLDYVQLGWLYNQLCQALIAHQGIVVFAHHQPNEMRRYLPNLREVVELKDFRVSESKLLLTRAIAAFPNIIGYFYGHEHGNASRLVERRSSSKEAPSDYAMIQTGSLADAPQVGRLVDIFTASNDGGNTGFVGKISWRFVRPAIAVGSPDGMRLAARLRASRKEADIEARETSSRKFWNRIIHWIPKSTPQLSAEPARECEGPNSRFLDADDRLPRDTVLAVHGHFADKCPTPLEVFGPEKGKSGGGGPYAMYWERRNVGVPRLMNYKPSDDRW